MSEPVKAKVKIERCLQKNASQDFGALFNEEIFQRNSIIEQVTPNFSLVLHLRDKGSIDPYCLRAVIYYTTPETEHVYVDSQSTEFKTAEPGEHLFKFDT